MLKNWIKGVLRAQQYEMIMVTIQRKKLWIFMIVNRNDDQKDLQQGAPPQTPQTQHRALCALFSPVNFKSGQI